MFKTMYLNLISIFRRIDSFYARVYSTRLRGVLFAVATMNIAIILLSAAFDWDEYSGYKPLKWFAISILTGLFTHEYYKEKKAKSDAVSFSPTPSH